MVTCSLHDAATAADAATVVFSHSQIIHTPLSHIGPGALGQQCHPPYMTRINDVSGEASSPASHCPQEMLHNISQNTICAAEDISLQDIESFHCMEHLSPDVI